MKDARMRLADLLDEKHLPYEKIHHDLDYTSQETAAHTRTPGRGFAKTVVVRIDDGFGLAVLPAHLRIDLERLRRWVSARSVRLATEEEMKQLFPDCEVGAEPPIGSLYDLPVYLSPLLALEETLTFNGGTHEDVVRMKTSDFTRLTRPSVIHFTLASS
jgi:Ala-tRNA(Pro) deacylase